MTTIFIIAIFAIIVIYDIIVYVNDYGTITGVFRVWYKKKPVVPFMVGVVFIGHFQTVIEWSNMYLFLAGSILYLIWYWLMSGTDIKWSRKFYNLSCKYFFIPLLMGTFLGIFWR